MYYDGFIINKTDIIPILWMEFLNQMNDDLIFDSGYGINVHKGPDSITVFVNHNNPNFVGLDNNYLGFTKGFNYYSIIESMDIFDL